MSRRVCWLNPVDHCCAWYCMKERVVQWWQSWNFLCIYHLAVLHPNPVSSSIFSYSLIQWYMVKNQNTLPVSPLLLKLILYQLYMFLPVVQGMVQDAEIGKWKISNLFPWCRNTVFIIQRSIAYPKEGVLQTGLVDDGRVACRHLTITEDCWAGHYFLDSVV